tara:strand:- start:1222 stop:1338 length:117 start_codon:yes stop_codon:yes gene_type:complete
MERSDFQPRVSKSFNGKGVAVVNVPLHKGRQLINWRPE